MKRPARSSWPLLAICIVLPLAVGFAGSFITRDQIPAWYAGLKKPWFTPPSWLFAPVWTTLYIMMGAASYGVARHGLSSPHVRPALTAYAVQLALNGVWTPVFFGWHQLWLALGIVGIMNLAILATIGLFRRVSKGAAKLLWPYLAWTGFATALNASIAWLNR